MAEEQEQEGTMSGLKKTIIGTLGTVVTAAGVWAASLLGGGDQEAAPVQAAPVINITTNQTQQQQQAASGGKTVIIREKSPEAKSTAQPVAKPKKKEGDEFKEEAPKW